MLTIYTKSHVFGRTQNPNQNLGIDYHIGQELNLKDLWDRPCSVDEVVEVFADGDEKAVIDTFIENIPKCTQVGVRSFYWYGDTAKSICAFLESYGKNIEKNGVDRGKNIYWIRPYEKTNSNHLDEICKNCGHEKGTHRATDHACSKLVRPKSAGLTGDWSTQYKFEAKNA